jgi:hypothetical protein
MRGSLDGLIVGAVSAKAGANSSADARQPQSLAPIGVSMRNVSGAGCIVNLTEFDLRQPQHTEYIFDIQGGAAWFFQCVFFCAASRRRWP